MKRSKDLDNLIDEITEDAHGDGEQFWAFRQALEDRIPLPLAALAIGEPVMVTGFDFDGNERRGIVAQCRRPNGRRYEVALPDLVLPEGTPYSRIAKAYRQWLGLEPSGEALPETLEVAILSARGRSARVILLETHEEAVLRSDRAVEAAPGEIALVHVVRKSKYRGMPCYTGSIGSVRLQIDRLQLPPLKLNDHGRWDPAEHYWGEPGVLIDAWARPIITRGPRPAYEMEQVLPGYHYSDPEEDPIGMAADLKQAGRRLQSREILMSLCEADLRCLDAHAHLGNLEFDRRPAAAIRHFEAGVRIGELSLGPDFDSVLAWSALDNRPFLRCLHGYGLCLWRLRKFPEAARVFERMLWLNPSDNQGVRFLLGPAKRKMPWTPDL